MDYNYFCKVLNNFHILNGHRTGIQSSTYFRVRSAVYSITNGTTRKYCWMFNNLIRFHPNTTSPWNLKKGEKASFNVLCHSFFHQVLNCRLFCQVKQQPSLKNSLLSWKRVERILGSPVMVLQSPRWKKYSSRLGKKWTALLVISFNRTVS